MAACNVGQMLLFIRIIVLDLDIPQEAATITYEDNNGCTAMANAPTPTTRSPHIIVKYFALCDWVECNLIHLERIVTSSTLLTTCRNLSRESCYPNMLLFYSGMSLPNTPQYTNRPLQHTAIDLTRPLTDSYPSPIQPP